MNERIKELSKEAFEYALSQHPGSDEFQPIWTEKFAELIKQAIYDEVKQDLVDDETIDAEPDIEDRCYLRGSNGGTVDALCIIKNFGVKE